jgi:YidC/Oxa1 family membrane protein insertase
MDDLKIEKFDLAIDFGWFWFFTKPFAEALTYFHGLLGNYGLAILLLTVIIKLIFFPLANKSYRAMSKMKALQPKMEELKERFGEDRQRMNTELMNLYKAATVTRCCSSPSRCATRRSSAGSTIFPHPTRSAS